MTHLRRIASIEEKDNNEPEAQKNAKITILLAQAALLSKLENLDSKIQRVVKALDSELTKQIINESEITFKALANINRGFDLLHANLDDCVKAEAIYQSHHSLVQALHLVIKLFKIIYIDAFIHKPLAALTSEDKEAVDADLEKRANLFYKEVDDFNQILRKAEEQNSEYAITVWDDKDGDLSANFDRLIREEKIFANLPVVSPVYQRLSKQHDELVNKVVKLIEETSEAIAEFKYFSQIEQKKRTKLCGSSLDVFYVSQFRAVHTQAMDAYRKEHDKRRYKTDVEVKAIQALINQLSIPLQDFEKDLSEAKYTLGFTAKTAAVNAILNLVTELSKSFKQKSSVISMQRKYPSNYGAFKNENKLPPAENKVESFFIKSAIKFIRGLSEEQILEMDKEAKRKQEREINNYVQRMQLQVGLTHIRPIRLLEQRKETLNKAWQDTFFIVLKHELMVIKSEYQRIKAHHSNSSLSELRHLNYKLQEKKAQIIARLARESVMLNGRHPVIIYMLNSVYSVLQPDPIFQEISHHLEKLRHEKRKPILQIADSAFVEEPESKNEWKMDVQPTLVDLPLAKRSTPWYKKCVDKPWKRAICCGLLAVAAVALALTVWGFIAELSAVAVIAAIGGTYGASAVAGGAFVMSSGSYYSLKCFCAHPAPLDDYLIQSSPILSSENPKPASGGSHRNILTSSVGKSQVNLNKPSTNPFDTPAERSTGWKSLFSWHSKKTPAIPTVSPITVQIDRWEQQYKFLKR